MYFLICLDDVRVRFLRDWRVKAMLVFGIASSTEVLQAFGVPLQGRTFDPTAQDILNRVDYDFARLHVPYKTVVLVCQRAKKLDAVTRDFLAEHPGSVVLQLGCGLDNRFWRVDDGRVNWYDLDMPPVVELRRQFFTESERYRLIAASVEKVRRTLTQ